MVLNLYLLRHGETDYNLKSSEIVGGQSNHLKLSGRGIEQAKALGQRLKDEGIVFNELYSSTALRARATAEIVCDVLGIPNDRIVSVPELLELSQGDWEGRLRAEVHTPEALADMARLHWDFKAPNGESQRELEERKYSWVNRTLIEGRENQLTVGLFGHGVATKCFLRRVMNSDPRLTYRIEIDNCSITHVKYATQGQHKGWGLVKVNDNAHLGRLGFAPTGHV